MLRITKRLLIGVILAALFMPMTAVPSSAQGLHLVIGRITDEPDKHVKRLNQMAEYLAADLLDLGISAVDVVMAENEDQMADLMRRGKVDILSETPFMALELEAEGVVTILMREWKKGVAQYHSVIVARKDGPVQSISDLAGRKIAFEDAGSTSGYLLPRNAIEVGGLTLAELVNPKGGVPGDKVGYYFTNSESGVIAAVHNGTADAGAVSNLDWAEKDTVPDAMRKDLQVIYETRPVIRSTVMVRATLPADIKERIASILEHMHESEQGREVMKDYSKVKRFDRIEGEALEGLEEARKIWERVRSRSS